MQTPDATSHFTFVTDAESEEYCLMIAEQLICLFGVSEEEAVGRVNRSFYGQALLGPLDWVYHEMPETWAHSIYYGPYLHWWVAGTELRPQTYPWSGKGERR